MKRSRFSEEQIIGILRDQEVFPRLHRAAICPSTLPAPIVRNTPRTSAGIAAGPIVNFAWRC
jgi:hypothetical protein